VVFNIKLSTEMHLRTQGSHCNDITKIQYFSGPLNIRKSLPLRRVNYGLVHNFKKNMVHSVTWKIYDADFV